MDLLFSTWVGLDKQQMFDTRSFMTEWIVNKLLYTLCVNMVWLVLVLNIKYIYSLELLLLHLLPAKAPVDELLKSSKLHQILLFCRCQEISSRIIW